MQILIMSLVISIFSNWMSTGERDTQVFENNNSGVYETPETNPIGGDSLIFPGEVHFKNMRMLTNGGDNAEAYWSFDDKKLIFQANVDKWNTSCDQIFIYDVGVTDAIHRTPAMLSTGKGRTTCSYFMPGNDKIIYASTHHMNAECPPVPEPRADHKYVWPVYAEYDLFVADLNGNIIEQLTDDPGYDAEATVSPKGDLIVFTSTRSGDLELYTMNIDGSNVQQVTDELGYDGGAFFSPDGKKLVFRASRPRSDEEVREYKEFLADGLVQPTAMELYTCNIDGSDMKKITDLGNANWAPFYHPSGKKILFSSNHESERGFPFNLYMINIDGTGLEQITYDEVFASFPMFSFDGKQLVFASNRNNGGTRATNLFLVDCVD
jgi:Tol biopolymer transport system component